MIVMFSLRCLQFCKRIHALMNMSWGCIKEKAMVTIHGAYVQFRFFCPDASNIHVVGELDGRQEKRFQMLPTSRHGEWIAAAKLTPGMYRFRYHVDGRRFVDPIVLHIMNSIDDMNVMHLESNKGVSPCKTDARRFTRQKAG